MILDTLGNAAKYAGLKIGISEAFGFLDQPGLAELPDGKYEIFGDRVYAMIAHVDGRAVSDGELEGHEYDAEKDLEFFEGDPKSIVRIPPGSFAIFLPTDAHLPLIGEGSIHKVVVKIAVC